MNRLEILKLALENTKDAKEAMALAREMESFLKGDTSAPTQAVLALPPPPPKELPAPPRNRSPWTEKEIANLKRFIKEGKSEGEIANIFGRSAHAVKCATYKLQNNVQLGRSK